MFPFQLFALADHADNSSRANMNVKHAGTLSNSNTKKHGIDSFTVRIRLSELTCHSHVIIGDCEKEWRG